MQDEADKRGTHIIGTYRSGAAEAQSLKQKIEALGAKATMLALDITDTASYQSFSDAMTDTLKNESGCERFDFLVKNAGNGLFANFTDATEEQFGSLIATHLRGPVFLTQKLLPLVEDDGRILNVFSGFVRFTLPGYSLYAAVKAAVEVLTRYMAVELGSRRIRVNAIAPGAIATDFGGSVVAAILSDDLAWANGTTFDVSGGQLL